MIYILLYSTLAIFSYNLLQSSNSFLNNALVVLATLGIFYLMLKRYVNSFGGREEFTKYYKSLVNINISEKEDKIDKKEKTDFELAKEKLKVIADDRKVANFESDNEVTINDPRFKVGGKNWFFLLFVYDVSTYTLAYLSNWSFFIVSILHFIMLFFIVLPLLIESWHGLRKTGLKKVILWSIAGYGLIYLLNIGNQIFFDIVGFEAADSLNQNLIKEILKNNFLRTAFEISVAAIIYEELIFRGIFFRNFFTKSKVLAYIATFIAFGFPHIFIGLVVNGITELYF